MRLEITDAARLDMYRLQDAGYQTFGFELTEKFLDEMTSIFKLIASNPHINRERKDFKQPMRMHFFKNHAIAYSVEDDCVKILRVIHGRRDLKSLL